jgi:enamine deaminase RidA (YjgF/YER057c/UK114 family)
MTRRQNISFGSSLEATYGYCRAREGRGTVYVAGTIGMDYATGRVDPDPGAQLRQAVRNIEPALGEAGASLRDVVQLTTYVTSAEVFDAIGPVLGEIFGGISPVNAALVVQIPIPYAKVEIAATAVIGCGG